MVVCIISIAMTAKKNEPRKYIFADHNRKNKGEDNYE